MKYEQSDVQNNNGEDKKISLNKEQNQKVSTNENETKTSPDSKQKQEIDDKKTKKTKYLLIGLVGLVVLVCLLVGGLFFSRCWFQHRQLVRRNNAKIGRDYSPVRHQNFGARQKKIFKNNSISGKVTAVDGQTFTVDQNGQAKKVQIGDETRFPLISQTKVNVGDEVLVWGEQDSSGVVQAVRIIVNPNS